MQFENKSRRRANSRRVSIFPAGEGSKAEDGVVRYNLDVTWKFCLETSS